MTRLSRRIGIWYDAARNFFGYFDSITELPEQSWAVRHLAWRTSWWAVTWLLDWKKWCFLLLRDKHYAYDACPALLIRRLYGPNGLFKANKIWCFRLCMCKTRLLRPRRCWWVLSILSWILASWRGVMSLKPYVWRLQGESMKGGSCRNRKCWKSPDFKCLLTDIAITYRWISKICRSLFQFRKMMVPRDRRGQCISISPPS